MVTTVLRKTDLLVVQGFPDAAQLTKIEKKQLVSHIYIGEPKNTSLYGMEPRIQTNDVLIEAGELSQFVTNERDKLSEKFKDQITISLNVDIGVKMGIVSDVQEELREVNARKILYTAQPRISD
jgi:hypothetical protein